MAGSGQTYFSSYGEALPYKGEIVKQEYPKEWGDAPENRRLTLSLATVLLLLVLALVVPNWPQINLPLEMRWFLVWVGAMILAVCGLMYAVAGEVAYQRQVELVFTVNNSDLDINLIAVHRSLKPIKAITKTAETPWGKLQGNDIKFEHLLAILGTHYRHIGIVLKDQAFTDKVVAQYNHEVQMLSLENAEANQAHSATPHA